MSESSVVAAAVALQRFTVSQVVAYSDADEFEISRVLRRLGKHVERLDDPSSDAAETDRGEVGLEQWRVLDPGYLRSMIQTPPIATSPLLPTAEPDDGPQLRLLRAEETLVACATEPESAIRKTRAMTALNYLKQHVAAKTGRRDWWSVDLTVERSVPPTAGEAPRSHDELTESPRLWLDVALARLTELQAAGRDPTWGFLIETATNMTELGVAIDESRLQEFVLLFIELASRTTALSVDDSPRTPAPTRLLSALGWRKVRALVEPDPSRAAHDVVPLLKWLSDRPPAAQVDRHRLFRFDRHLPDGRNIVRVFSHLLPILPRQFMYEPRSEPVPGLVVDVLADSAAVEHLERYARLVEENLMEAPYGSESALIGITEHVFRALAARSVDLDHAADERCSQTRLELLSLADVVSTEPAADLDRSTRTDGGHRA